jgi:hypothetical protein
MNNIYIPKYKVKGFASYMYGGENDENYNDYTMFSNKNTLFED